MDSIKSQPEKVLLCPHDGYRMEKERFGGITIDRCANCGCLWLDAHELDRILSVKGGATKVDLGPYGQKLQRSALGDRCCPRDGTELMPMADSRQPHVKYLGCTKCGGLCLDAGDLMDLSEFTITERLRGLFK
jgi:Zn-finger nucleic acid-binding protein